MKEIPDVPELKAGSDGHVYDLSGNRRNESISLRYHYTYVRSYGRVHQVHRLIALAFHGRPPAGTEVDHIDSDPSNNCPTNLQYLSHLENARKSNKRYRGEKHPRAKLTEATVRKIRALHAKREISRKQLADRFGVTLSCLDKIIYRQLWTHI